jgi:hypothetical protein
VGNLSVRFLGVDAPEASFPLPGGDAAREEQWNEKCR